jgi:hypothetical protein
VAFILLLVFALLSDAQQHDAHAPAVPKPATLTRGLGRLHHPITKQFRDAWKSADVQLRLGDF